MPKAEDSHKVMIAALDQLQSALDEIVTARKTVTRRATKLRRQLEAKKSLTEIVSTEEVPLIVQTLRQTNAQLTEAFSRFQRAEAYLLYREGMSMERIGRLFGLSRQRVADLVRR